MKNKNLNYYFVGLEDIYSGEEWDLFTSKDYKSAQKDFIQRKSRLNLDPRDANHMILILGKLEYDCEVMTTIKAYSCKDKKEIRK